MTQPEEIVVETGNLRVIGDTIPGAPMGFMAVPTRCSPEEVAAAISRTRWFRCRFCNIHHVGGPNQPVAEEAVACFAHEALCRSRPAGRELSDRERRALETAYGTQIRACITNLEGVLPADRAAAAERIGLLRADLIRLGLPKNSPTIPD